MNDVHSELEKLSTEELFKKFQSDAKTGLSTQEAEKRLSKEGLNEIQQKKKSQWMTLLSFFWGPIPWMIEIAVILSALLERWPDFIIILAMLLINATLGFIQEYQAGNAIAALKEKLALKSRTLRDGKWLDLEAKHLVPGDVISVKLGNIIPADIKLFSGEYLSVDQSALTGESLPVDKKLGEVAYSSTIAKKGEMNAIVIATGMDTFIGKTAKLVDNAETKSHFQEAVLKIGRFLIAVTLIICAIILAASIYRVDIEKSTHETFGQMAIFILVLVIAGIPVALPAVLSVTMAIGAHKLAKLKAIVSKLTAIEELANLNVLCSDKTGTLTKNELTVGNVMPYEAKDDQEVLLYASLASNQDLPDSIDKAILNQLQKKEELKNFNCDKFIPFDPVRKSSEAIVKAREGNSFHVCKGATQVILDLVKPDTDKREEIQKSIDDCSSKGFRTIGVAKSDSEGNTWQFVGIIPLFDPPREDTKETVDYLKNLGVEIHMVTGDNASIAKQISSQLDLGSNIVSISEISEKGDQAFCDAIKNADGFAQVFPEHKFKIIKALQDKKYILGMTGDGVNDAPALKQADVGIAVSGASDAARSAADLVLTESGLMTITRAVEESRRVFGRMKSYAMYRISETCRLLLFLLLSMLFLNEHPLSAIMIILIALLNDIPIMTIAYDNMEVKQDPVQWRMDEVFTISIGLAIVGVLSTFGLFWIGSYYWHLDFEHLKTLAFMGILCGGNLTIYLMRNETMLWSNPWPHWKFIGATSLSLVIGTIISVYGLGTTDFLGIGWKYVIYSWIYIFIWFAICFLTKLVLYAIFGFNKKREPHARDNRQQKTS
ncbi:MAG: Calcium-transporting ATPase [Chlamydiae bacterium]|nr:Calcium-transporting ATPase [Chlamydiota bacterium]